MVQSLQHCFDLLNTIDTRLNLNIYCQYDYDTLITSLPINTSLGESLKRSRDPNSTLNNYIVKSDALAIYTDGSRTSKGVGSACISPQVDIYLKKKNSFLFICVYGRMHRSE